VLQLATMHCSVLQCAAGSVDIREDACDAECCSVLPFVAVCCRI